MEEYPSTGNHKHIAWNKGKLIGPKPALSPKHVWSIRTKLQVEDQTRELAMFNLAIDSKLRGCDVLTLKVEDVAPTDTPLKGRLSARRNRSASSI